MIQVAIVDDHQIVRTGFRELLSEDSAIRVSFEAANGDDALAQLRTQECDVLLLDISLPGKSGVDVLRAVRQRYPELKVLILSVFPEESYALANAQEWREWLSVQGLRRRRRCCGRSVPSMRDAVTCRHVRQNCWLMK